MAELIFEIGCEELPARFVEPALDQLRREIELRCEEARVAISGVRVVGTPRRLALLIDEVAPTQKDLEEERTGPPAAIAFDDDGNPTKAAQGFARGQGVDVDDLYEVTTDKGEYIAAKVFEQGAPTEELLPGILSDALRALSFPKSMRWAAHRATFARPVRWIVALLGDDVLELEFTGVASGAMTCGHRFSAPEPIEVTSIAQYIDALSAADVEVDPDQRREMIRSLLEVEAEGAGGVIVEDPALIDEVTFLVEKVHAVLVTFSEEYLELPDEVLISSMRSHQRYFAIEHPDTGALLNACAVIYNTPVRDPDVVRAGNLRVLRARLDDAVFFWKQDLEKPLGEQVEHLGDVVWLQALGSTRERCERMSQTAARVAERIGLEREAVDAASRAAYLSKADLVTAMVGEFPDLQGVMGREYARHTGESEQVATAIAEQYMPAGADDDTPETRVGACVALAERLDSLIGLFGVGNAPSSNADPYGLRRAAIGVLRIIEEHHLDVALSEILVMAYGAYKAQEKLEAFAHERDVLIAEVRDFISTRYRHQLAMDFPGDVVDAVLAIASDDVLSVRDRVAALAKLRDEADFEPLAIGFKRVVNILRKQADEQYEIPENVDPDALSDDEEQALFERAQDARAQIDAALQTRDWDAACTALIVLKEPIDAFFDNVMVMADDEELRRNRLALLDMLRDLFLRVADISRIQTG